MVVGGRVRFSTVNDRNPSFSMAAKKSVSPPTPHDRVAISKAVTPQDYPCVA